MARVPESWYRLFRSIAVPTLLIACPTLLAGHWNAWRHFLGLADTATQCVLAAAPVLLTEAAAALALALVLCSLIVRGRLGNTAIETCADVLTMLVIGYSASRIFAACRWLDRTHPGLLAAAAVAMLIALRVRNGSPRLHLQQYNASSAFILPAYAVLAAVLMPGRVEWRRFDAIPADPPAAAAAQQRPDVVLITFDALSAQDMSLLHYHLPTTPNFQRLARSSHVFTHFYSSCDFTTPAVVTLITGKDLLSHRVYQLTGIVPRAIRAQNVAQVLKDAGYRTMAVVTNNYAHPLHLGIDGSFDYLPEPPANAWLRPAGWPLQLGHTLLFDSDASPTSWIAPLLRVSGRFFPSFNQNPSVDPARVFDLSERLMASVNGPEFIWIHLFAPHFPYVTRPPFRGRFLHANRFLTQADFAAARRLGHYRDRLQPVFDDLRARYDESIAQSDAAFGSFLDWLDRSGRRPHTLVVVSADHGEAFHQWWGHESPFLLYPEVHIPLLISTPGQKNSVRHDEDAGLADIAPTILDSIGMQPPRWMTGHPLLSAAKSGQPAFAAYLARSYTFGPPQMGSISAFSGDYQLTWYFPLGVKRLFNTAEDPDGIRDVIRQHPEIAASLTRAIRSRFGARIPALNNE